MESMIRGVMTLALALLPALFASCGKAHAGQGAMGREVSMGSAHGTAPEAH